MPDTGLPPAPRPVAPVPIQLRTPPPPPATPGADQPLQRVHGADDPTVNLSADLPANSPELAADLGLAWEAHPEPRPDQREALRQALPLRLALRQQLLPLEFRNPLTLEQETDPAAAAVLVPDARLVLATARPFDLISRQLAVAAVSRPIEWVLAPEDALREALQRFYGVGADTFEQILEGRDFDPSTLEDQDEASVLDSGDEEASVVKFVNQILRDGLEQRATDIHFEPLADSLRIRYRIDGVLQEATVPPNIRQLQSSVIARLKIMSRLDIAEKRLPQDGRIHLQSGGQDIDVRVATIPTVEGESVSLRLLNQEKYTLDRLGLPRRERDWVEELLALPNGIILVTGPTGSGKSTSLYTFLSQLNTPGQRIVTIEDPVENKLPGVMQIAVRPEINLTFAAGLRSILRGDPNIVMIGEIRDLETAEIAIRASLTGHLVFSTLHTNDAIGGVHRLIDMGCEPFLVAASVRAFFAQRLVRRLCEKCAAPPQELDHLLLDSLGVPREGRENIREPRGCPACRGTGYRGRLAIYEIVQVTRKLGDQIARNTPYNELAATARAQGSRWLREYGWGKMLEGQTSLAEVISATAHSDEDGD